MSLVADERLQLPIILMSVDAQSHDMTDHHATFNTDRHTTSRQTDRQTDRQTASRQTASTHTQQNW